VERRTSRAVSVLKGGAHMREKPLPEWAVEIGAEVRKRIGEPPMNEPCILDLSELLRAISDRELAERRRRCGREVPV
jgi:hypothetical protein